MSVRPIPPVSEVAKPYWDAARKNELVIQKCSACGHTQFPPRAHCSSCGSDQLTWYAVSGLGKIYSYTIAHRPPHPVFSEQIPLVVAIVELDEGPRMMSNIVDCDTANLAPGMPVRVAFEPIDDSDIVLPVFAPI